ncbi:MAG: hypothetical protein H6672_05285 [Anaerolineaceae bacterium]|nr:hypothetical protein [Anaerolineaceae bacterium]
MDFGEQVRITFDAYSHYLLLLGIWGGAVIVALMRWRQHPRVSLLVVVGLVILALQLVVQTYISVWLPINMSEEGQSAAQIGLALRDIGIVNILITSLAWILIMVALFGWRGKALAARAESEDGVIREL